MQVVPDFHNTIAEVRLNVYERWCSSEAKTVWMSDLQLRQAEMVVSSNSKTE